MYNILVLTGSFLTMALYPSECLVRREDIIVRCLYKSSLSFIDYFTNRLKEDRILLSRDGPDENVLKFKPPMCFSLENLDLLLTKLDAMFDELKSRSDNSNHSSDANEMSTSGKKKLSDDNPSNSSIAEEPPLKKKANGHNGVTTSVAVH